MELRPTVLCPVDFSVASRGALRHAAAIAQHFQAQLTVLTVNDPLVTEAAVIRLGTRWLPQDSEHELRRFVDDTFGGTSVPHLQLVVTAGKAAPEILRVAREHRHDLIVMSSHGLTGIRKLFFGATTERVLRETNVPVLITPPVDKGPIGLEDVGAQVGRILAPVDLTGATARQVKVARGLAEALGVPLLLAHVIEPVRVGGRPDALLPSVNVERRGRADDAMRQLLEPLPPRIRPEGLTLFGDPAEEIAKLAQDRQAGLIVMGLHASPMGGPRMGSVTYRVLCLTRTLVLALPPAPDQSIHRLDHTRGAWAGQGARA